MFLDGIIVIRAVIDCHVIFPCYSCMNVYADVLTQNWVGGKPVACIPLYHNISIDTDLKFWDPFWFLRLRCMAEFRKYIATTMQSALR